MSLRSLVARSRRGSMRRRNVGCVVLAFALFALSGVGGSPATITTTTSTRAGEDAGFMPISALGVTSRAAAQRIEDLEDLEIPEPSTDRPADRIADFWREAHYPGARRARTLFRHGMRQLARAMRTTDPRSRASLLTGAIGRLRRAHERAPTNAEILYFYAFAVSQTAGGAGELDSTVRRRVNLALRLFERLRELDDDHEAQAVAFEMGLLYSRRGDYPTAAAAYERAIARAFDPRSTVSAHGNMAEVIMLTGEVELALQHYLRAAEIARQNQRETLSLALAYWGAAIASDRLGESNAAVEYAGRAVSAGGGTMLPLRSDGVFFEPANEIHWYEGLGHLANSAAEPEEEDQRIHLESALDSFELYLETAESERDWDVLVRRRITQIRAQLEAPAPARTRGRRRR